MGELPIGVDRDKTRSQGKKFEILNLAARYMLMAKMLFLMERKGR